jgi:hypothetical protein
MIDIVSLLTTPVSIPECLSKDFKFEMLGESGEVWIDLISIEDSDIQLVVDVDGIRFYNADGASFELSPEQLRALADLQESFKRIVSGEP